MSRTHADVTLTIDGDERDVQVRAYTEHHRGPGHWGYRVDGDVEACLDGEWIALDDLSLDSEDEDRARDALFDVAETEDGARYCA